MTFIGIDLGTSAIKAVLVGAEQRILAKASVPLETQQPRDLWSEQDAAQWPEATAKIFSLLKAQAPIEFASCEAIGLSGHMHGAVLIDTTGAPLRPCILWNDGRSFLECAELEAALPALRQITGNIAMPGFTAPKIAWVRKCEPEIFARIHKVLLPKAYLRYWLTGECIEEMSDASGTLWLDVGARDWSDAMLAATGLTQQNMPRLVEGSTAAGRMKADLATIYGFNRPPMFAGGAGDNASGAVGLGATDAGDAFLSLGTSGVLWRTTAEFLPRPKSAVHAFCHALPERWHQMSVHLSAASCLAWWAGITGVTEDALLRPLGAQVPSPADAVFLPYLSGERTPHNDPTMRAGFFGLNQTSAQSTMTQAVLEGVAFALRDGLLAMEANGPRIEQMTAIGGGTRSDLWLQIIADVLGRPINRVTGSDMAGALGAARLARLSVSGEAIDAVCTKPAPDRTFVPRLEMADAYARRYIQWQRIVTATRDCRISVA